MKENELRTNSNSYNEGTKNAQLIHEIHNSAYNHRYIVDAFKAGRARDLSDEPKHHGQQCIVVGSGPSLDDAIPFMKEWTGGILCTTSHARTLMYYGIEPTHIVALDPFCVWDEMKGIDWSKTKTKLVVQPGCWPDLIENWPNEMLLYRQDLAQKNNFYSVELNFMYTKREKVKDGAPRDFTFNSLIKTQMTVFACSPPAQLFTADNLQYDRVFLVGCDFAYNNKKERFTGWIPTEEGWVEDAHPYVEKEEDIPEVKPSALTNASSKHAEIITNNGLISTVHHLYYKKNMLSAIRLSMQDVWVVGKGAITEVPNISAKDMVRKQHLKIGKRPDKKKIKKVIEKYLADIGAYVVISNFNGKEALTFVESNKPEEEILNYMKNMKRVYYCKKCQLEVQSNNDEEQEGAECPRCKQKELTHKFDVDIKANMKRIMAY